MTQKEYAEHIDRSQQYVSKLITEGKIPTLRDGSIDPDAADAARARNTNLFRGEIRHRRRKARQRAPQPQQLRTGAVPVCQGCGDHYIERFSRNELTPNPTRFCSPSCQQDVKDGLTRKQIFARRDRGIINKHPRYAPTPKPLPPPPKQPPVIRICVGCGGRYDLNDIHLSPTEIYCDGTCEEMVAAGLTREEIRRSIKRSCAEGGTSRKELDKPTFFDQV